MGKRRSLPAAALAVMLGGAWAAFGRAAAAAPPPAACLAGWQDVAAAAGGFGLDAAELAAVAADAAALCGLGDVNPPAPPAPGVNLDAGCGPAGAQACQGFVPVDARVTRAVALVTGDATVRVGSVTVAASPYGPGWTVDMAVAVAAAAGPVTTDCAGLAAAGDPFRLRYAGSHWPSQRVGRPFDYPTDPGFLALLQRQGWLDGRRLDVGDAPAAVAPGDVWSYQPAVGEVASLAPLVRAEPRLAGLHLPGTLYVNTLLGYDPPRDRWRVLSWNYNFAIRADFVQGLAGCAPPAAAGPGSDAWSIPCPDGSVPDPGRPGEGCVRPVLAP